jgi:ketosteroid isomerase-like protein
VVSRDNVALVEAAYADPAGLFRASGDRVAQDAEFDFSAVYPDRPILTGREAVLSFREEGPWAEVSFTAERVFDVDEERVLVFVLAQFVGKESAIPVTQRTAHEITIRNGKLTRFKVYLDRTEALEAAGLAE